MIVCCLWLFLRAAQGVLEPPVALAVGGGGATIAVRSVRSGLPRRHLRHSLRLFLQIPSGASTRPATPDRQRNGLTVSGVHGCWGGWCAWRFCRRLGVREGSCEARPKPAARAAFLGLRDVGRREGGGGAAGGAACGVGRRRGLKADSGPIRTPLIASEQRTPPRRRTSCMPLMAARAAINGGRRKTLS